MNSRTKGKDCVSETRTLLTSARMETSLQKKQRRHLTIHYDHRHMTPSLTLTPNPSDTKKTKNTKKITGGYHAWGENNDSTSEDISVILHNYLASRNNFANVSFLNSVCKFGSAHELSQTIQTESSDSLCFKSQK